MSKLGIFMADGCEEIEGLTVVDIVRRAGIDIQMLSITDNMEVTGSHGIVFRADALARKMDYAQLDGIILPGGMPGTLQLGADETVQRVIREFAAAGKLVCAICAAPSVLGEAGILQGKKAVCYPGFERQLIGAVCLEDAVAVDGNIITSRGMGTVIPFALAIVRCLEGDAAADALAEGIIYRA